MDCSHIIFGGARLGTYYLENGVSVRPASVVYDREGSSMATAKAEEFDWDAILEGADLLHTSGITPVLSEDAKEIVLQALKAAKAKRITTSFDLNYRGKLWTTGVKEKQEMMAGLMPYVDICFGNARDAAMVLGYRDKNTDFINGDYDICINTENMQKVLNYFGFTYLVSSLRNSLSASYNGYSGEVVTAQKWHIG
ncbi:MAG: PfkB family carbohydrate kinase, partial [Eubacterium sp.]